MSHLSSASALVVAFVVGCGGGAATTAAPVATSPNNSGSAATPATAGVAFTKRRPAVGDVSTSHERNETRLDLDITVDGAVTHSTDVTVETVERRTVTLALGDDGAVTRVKVAYTANHKEETGKGVTTSPVEGKTYLLQGRDGKSPPAVTDASGNVVPKAEADVAADDFKHLGRVDPFWSALPDHAISPGDSMDDMAKALAEGDSEDGLEHVVVRFDGAQDVGGAPAGVFDVQLSGEVAGERTTIGGKIALLLATGREVLSDASGPLQLKQQGTRNGKSFSVDAHGTLHLHKETSYESQ